MYPGNRIFNGIKAATVFRSRSYWSQSLDTDNGHLRHGDGEVTGSGVYPGNRIFFVNEFHT